MRKALILLAVMNDDDDDVGHRRLRREGPALPFVDFSGSETHRRNARPKTEITGLGSEKLRDGDHVARLVCQV